MESFVLIERKYANTDFAANLAERTILVAKKNKPGWGMLAGWCSLDRWTFARWGQR